MNIKNLLEKKVKSLKRKKILFVEGYDSRMIEAAHELKKNFNIDPILVFQNKNEMENINLENIGYFLISEFEDKKLLVDTFKKIREGKLDYENAEQLVQRNDFFSALLLHLDLVDGVIGGVDRTSKEILSSAIKIVGRKSKDKIVSSVVLMSKENKHVIFTDPSVNIAPNIEQLTDIASNAKDFANTLGVNDNIAFLSFSTYGSASSAETIKMKDATNMYNNKYKPVQKALGEIQFDAAYNLEIRKNKLKDKYMETEIGIFVFPNLEAGNLSIKIAQQMGGWVAFGPILVGLNKPMNDLSRGSTVEDIVYTAIITACSSK